MITNLTTKDKYTETAERQLEQARQDCRQTEEGERERRKAENHHKYMMGGIIVKLS